MEKHTTLVAALFLACFSFAASNEISSAKKINLTLYYETLCPDSQDFIVNQLYPTYEKVSSIFNVELVPYGNAEERQIGKKWKFDCQHGRIECIGNLIQSCAVNLIKKPESIVEFVHCFTMNIVDENLVENPLSVAEQCAEDLDISYAPIEDCQRSMMGRKLQHEMAVKTNALKPKHRYVPWVTLDGQHSDGLQEKAEANLLNLLCERYKGTKPSDCKDVHEGRCYKGKKKHQFDYYSFV